MKNETFSNQSNRQTKDKKNVKENKNVDLSVEQLMTPENNIVDVFEFEPVGFMSKGRW